MSVEKLNTPQNIVAKWVQPFNAINLFIQNFYKKFQKKSQQTITGIYKYITYKYLPTVRPKLIHKEVL